MAGTNGNSGTASQSRGAPSYDFSIMEQTKRVCVQYGTRSKIISFLSDGVKDIARITEAPKRAFAGDLPTSKIEFQSFDKLFDEWIDVDDAEPVDDLKKLRLVCHVGRQVGNFTWPQVVASHR